MTRTRPEISLALQMLYRNCNTSFLSIILVGIVPTGQLMCVGVKKHESHRPVLHRILGKGTPSGEEAGLTVFTIFNACFNSGC